MKAGVASPNGVVIQDVPEPKPKPTDILVKVKAIALNRADLGSARGDTSHGADRRPADRQRVLRRGDRGRRRGARLQGAATA